MTSPPEVAPVTRLIDQPRVSRYSEAARDPNPIHTDAAFAAATDFGRPIAHGMLVLALVSEAMSAAFGRRWAETGTLKVRWRAPAIQPSRSPRRQSLAASRAAWRRTRAVRGCGRRGVADGTATVGVGQA